MVLVEPGAGGSAMSELDAAGQSPLVGSQAIHGSQCLGTLVRPASASAASSRSAPASCGEVGVAVAFAFRPRFRVKPFEVSRGDSPQRMSWPSSAAACRTIIRAVLDRRWSMSYQEFTPHAWSSFCFVRFAEPQLHDDSQSPISIQ